MPSSSSHKGQEGKKYIYPGGKTMNKGKLPENMKVCLVPLSAQPPTFGMVMSLLSIADSYDEIIICLEDNPIVIPTDLVVRMLQMVFRYPKFIIISHPTNFENVVEFPKDLPWFNYVATISDRIYTNLIIKGFGCYLIPRAIGYDEYFHRSAFRQSQVLDMMRLRNSAVPLNKMKKSESSDGGE
jgi:hypothetical protein